MSNDPAYQVLMANADATKRGALPMWTVYDRPKDHPHGFIARLHEVKGAPIATAMTVKGELEAIRETFKRAGMIVIERDPKDDPKIVETWL